MKDRNAFNYRSEGSDEALIEEYELARSRRIPWPRLCGVHCTALGSPSSRSGSGSPSTSTRRSGDPAHTLV
jgi:hypothetical protein